MGCSIFQEGDVVWNVFHKYDSVENKETNGRHIMMHEPEIPSSKSMKSWRLLKEKQKRYLTTTALLRVFRSVRHVEVSLIPSVLQGCSVRTEKANLIGCSQKMHFSLVVLVLLDALHYNMTHFNSGISLLGQYSAAAAGVEVVGSYS